MSTLTTIEVVNTNLILSDLHPSSQYFISVCICNHFDCGSSSSAITIRTSSSSMSNISIQKSTSSLSLSLCDIAVFDTSPVLINKPSSIQAKIHYITSNEIGLKIFYPSEIIEKLIITYKISNASLIHQLNISPPLFNIRLTNLSCGNIYEIQIYASNQGGVSPMEDFSIKTEGSGKDFL